MDIVGTTILVISWVTILASFRYGVLPILQELDEKKQDKRIEPVGE